MNKSVLFLSLVCLLFVGCKEKEVKQAVTATPDFEFADGVITKYNGTETDVVIPSQIQGQAVTEIEEAAFIRKQLTSVIIPNGITRIGSAAFCDNELESVNIPNGVTQIEYSAFSKNQLNSITIPNSVTIIGMMAFTLNKLNSVTIPNNVVTIGQEAFSGNHLTSITIGANVALGGWDALYDAPILAFDNNFDKAYNSGGKKAGTYTLNNGKWVRK